jgi:hypothetical protein
MKIATKTLTHVALAAAMSVGFAGFAIAGDSAEKIGTGTRSAVTAPGQILKGIEKETNEKGAVAGVAVGTAKGSVKAAEQAVEGGANVAVGAAETGANVVKGILKPLGGD